MNLPKNWQKLREEAALLHSNYLAQGQAQAVQFFALIGGRRRVCVYTSKGVEIWRSRSDSIPLVVLPNQEKL